MALKIVIVGGVAGGASAAAKARRVNESAEIVLFEKGPYVSFANCGLPYYIGEEIRERQSLFLQTPQSFWDRFRVLARVQHEVLRIDRNAHQVEVKNLKSGQIFFEAYDKLILAPGAGAIRPSLAGSSARNIFTVKTVPDSDAIREFISEQKPHRAVVIGAGFIGLETAEALKRRGLDVTIVEKLTQVLPPFDPDMAGLVARRLEEQGIRLILGDGLQAFLGDPFADVVKLESGRQIPADMVILSIGVRPELKLAREAGLTIGAAGGISVNESQQTSDPDIYAAGDAVEVVQEVTGRKTRIPLAGPASKEGRVAGANAAGGTLQFPGALGTAIVEAMGLTAAKTGLSERDALAAGLDLMVSVTHSLDHAGYYPGSSLVHIKLLAERATGRLLGAQVVGESGVDKRIDVLATALSARLHVSDLENLDLAYAPQFSSAKDPVVIAGFAAANIVRREVSVITCDELQERLHRGDTLQLIDVRTPEEYDASHLGGAQLIPLDELRERLTELDPKKKTVVYCRVGFRGYLAARILQQHGFSNVKNLSGGILICSEPNSTRITPSGANGIISASALRQALTQPGVVVLDIREKDEFNYEHVAGTRNVPFESLLESTAALPKEKDLYVLCQSGIRTTQAAKQLRYHGFKHVHSLEGGLDAWKQAGFAVEQPSAPLPMMRQVQIIAGGLAFLGGAVPELRWLAAVVGAGLLFAGFSGTCGMAKVLSYMPWNKSLRETKKPDANYGVCRTR